MKQILSLLIFICLSIYIAKPALAAGAVMGLTPNSGTYTVGTAFNADLTINGNGEAFNAAKATVAVSNNLYVKALTIGNCNFAYVLTPTITNPSFTGVILGGSSQNCTAYTLTLLPLSQGTGTITLSNSAVKSYPNAEDTLTSLQNGNYTINSSSSGISTITPPAQNQQQQNQEAVTQTSPYTLTVTALTGDNTPLTGVKVILDPPQPASSVSQTSPTSQTPNTSSSLAINTLSEQTAVTDAKGVAVFTNLSEGVHQAVIENNGKKVAGQILNINGTNHTIALGIKTQKQPFNPISIITIALSAIIILTIIFFLIRFTNLLHLIKRK